jgi:hypothetical protein
MKRREYYTWIPLELKGSIPQISKDTIAEVMKRFDELQGKTSSTNE